MERRALYNSLRMNALLDPQSSYEQWQIEDYRALSLEDLFLRLEKLGLKMDKTIFSNLAERYETPEDLSDSIAKELDPEEDDKVYLIIFELWRRLVPEKQSLSIFCDELDYRIQKYDAGLPEANEGVEDSLANLEMILDENSDNGANPQELFHSVLAGCANDVENFLYDFIQEHIEHQNFTYASELIEGFLPYVSDTKWLEFFKAQALFESDREAAIKIMEQLMKGKNKNADLELNLEMLAFLSKSGEEKLFKSLAKQTIPLLEVEEDFQDFASITADFCHYSDKDEKEKEVLELIEKRVKIPPNTPFQEEDLQAKELLKILNNF